MTVESILLEIAKNAGPQSASILLGLYLLSKSLRTDKTDFNDQLKETVAYLREDMRVLTLAVQKNTIENGRLEVKIESLTKLFARTDKLEEDMDMAHAKLRELKGSN